MTPGPAPAFAHGIHFHVLPDVGGPSAYFWRVWRRAPVDPPRGEGGRRRRLPPARPGADPGGAAAPAARGEDRLRRARGPAAPGAHQVPGGGPPDRGGGQLAALARARGGGQAAVRRVRRGHARDRGDVPARAGPSCSPTTRSSASSRRCGRPRTTSGPTTSCTAARSTGSGRSIGRVEAIGLVAPELDARLVLIGGFKRAHPGYQEELERLDRLRARGLRRPQAAGRGGRGARSRARRPDDAEPPPRARRRHGQQDVRVHGRRAPGDRPRLPGLARGRRRHRCRPGRRLRGPVRARGRDGGAPSRPRAGAGDGAPRRRGRRHHLQLAERGREADRALRRASREQGPQRAGGIIWGAVRRRFSRARGRRRPRSPARAGARR